MIELDEGLVRSGRVTCGFKVGFITEVGRRTYSIRWLDGETTTQLRPDLDEEVEDTCALITSAVDQIDQRWDHIRKLKAEMV